MGSREVITRSEWVKALKCRLKSSEFELLHCKVKPLGTTSGGFLGEHSLAEITVRVGDSVKREQVLHYFVKNEPQGNDFQKEMVVQSGCFAKEVGGLSNLFVQLRSVLENGGKGMEWTCKCFYTRPDVVVLEDLVHQGYRLIGGRETMGYQRSALVLKALANLHAASLIFEETRPVQPYRLDEVYSDVLSLGLFQHAPNHPGTGWMQAGKEAILTLVEQIHGDATVRKIEDRVNEAMESLFEFQRPSKKFRNVVNHGDLWRNNIFFLHEEGEAVATRLVDFQLTRYAPPANDITCFLYLTSNRSFREQHMSQLLALYYEHLSKNLRRHGLDPEQVLPRKEFNESCEFYKKMGVVVAAHYGSVTMLNVDALTHVFASPEEYARFTQNDRTPEITKEFKNDSFYRESVTEIVEELFEEFIDEK